MISQTSISESVPPTSLVAKYATLHKVEVLETLEHSFKTSEAAWPESLIRKGKFYPPESLPNGRTVLFFPDYGNTLREAWKKPQQCDTNTTLWECVYQLIAAVEFLHEHGVAHLDIKSSKIALRVHSCNDCDVTVRPSLVSPHISRSSTSAHRSPS